MCWSEPTELVETHINGIVNSPWNKPFTGTITIDDGETVWTLSCKDGELVTLNCGSKGLP
jgi:hypothetical protein